MSLLEPRELFVLGDNPSESYDSRNYGPISEDLVLVKIDKCRAC